MCKKFSLKGKYKNVETYDINSAFAYIMSGNDNHIKLDIPVSKPTYKTIKQDEFDKMEYYNYGIYNCIVEKSGIEYIDRLFRFNNSNKEYTHIDLNCVKLLNSRIKDKSKQLKIKIIEKNNNVMLYEKNRVLNTDLFYEYFKCCFNYDNKNKITTRKQGNIFKILSCKFHGLLASKKKRIINLNNDKEHVINNDETIVNIYDNFKSIDVSNKNFIYPYARMSVFICAKVREFLLKTMIKNAKYLNNIIRVNTDSFSIINEDLSDYMNMGDKIGQFKLEKKYCGDIEIVNLNTVYKLNNKEERIENNNDDNNPPPSTTINQRFRRVAHSPVI
jgi:hypothetical protein